MSEEATKHLFERLPQTVVPTNYDLTIQPFLDTFKFNGSVIIDIQVQFFG
jgi:aminopeptidase 2